MHTEIESWPIALQDWYHFVHDFVTADGRTSPARRIELARRETWYEAADPFDFIANMRPMGGDR